MGPFLIVAGLLTTVTGVLVSLAQGKQEFARKSPKPAAKPAEVKEETK